MILVIFSGTTSPRRRFGSPSGGPQSALEHADGEAALREQERGRRAAPPALAVDDEFAAPLEDRKAVANLVQGDVERAGQPVIAVLGGVAHVQPGRAARDALESSCVAHTLH